MTIHDQARQILRADPTQRMGQAYYNAARTTEDGRGWLELFIDGTPLDPFNDDQSLPAFLTCWYENGGEDA